MGNMRLVFDQVSAEEKARIAMEAAIRAARQGRREAEIVPGQQPCWYVLTTHPAHERVVHAHLAGRRFGSFLPEIVRREVRRGRVAARFVLPMPGYVFVFTWGFRQHWARIRACAGVRGVLGDETGNPLPVSDEQINSLRQIIAAASPLIADLGQVSGQTAAEGKRKRRRRRPRKHRGGILRSSTAELAPLGESA